MRIWPETLGGPAARYGEQMPGAFGSDTPWVGRSEQKMAFGSLEARRSQDCRRKVVSKRLIPRELESLERESSDRPKWPGAFGRMVVWSD
jgi:hypothetical protein